MNKHCTSALRDNLKSHTAKVNATPESKPKLLPVSTNFYRYILDRIKASCRMINRDEIYADAVNAIAKYLDSGIVPASDCKPELQLIFTLLRPEIDKAISRSAAARNRKSGKKQDSVMSGLPKNKPAQKHAAIDGESVSKSDIHVVCDEQQESELPPVQPRLNRAQRRSIRQELKRATRLRNKPLQTRG